MKIDSSYNPSIAGSMPQSSRKMTGGGVPAGSAEVRLSATASQLASADSSPPMNIDRIAEIKQAITEGHFKINAGAIADSLIATARELVDSRRSAI